MRAAHRYLAAGIALATASAVAVAPIASRSAEPEIAGPAMRLAADESLLNVPINLFNDLVNIPYHEVEGLDTLARSLFFTGTWWVPSATNIWGVDPGDPTHVDAVTSMLVPFPELARGIEYQISGLMAAEFPVNEACDATGCEPFDPPEAITGVPLIDGTIWSALALTGLEPSDLSDNWNLVPLSDLFGGYHFDPDAPGSTNPSGEVHDGFGFVNGGEDNNIFEGGTGDDHAMPWSGEDFTLNPVKPVEDYFNSLLAPPSTDGVFGTGIEIPAIEYIGRTFQSVLAALVIDFDPFTPGSPFCPGDCSIVTGLGLDYPDLVQGIGNIWPGNELIDDWLHAFAEGTANGPTHAQIDSAIDATSHILNPFQFFNLLDTL